MSDAIVSVRNLSVRYKTRESTIHAVDNISFDLRRGQRHGEAGGVGGRRQFFGAGQSAGLLRACRPAHRKPIQRSARGAVDRSAAFGERADRSGPRAVELIRTADGSALAGVLCGAAFMHLARQNGHAGATGAETVDSTLSLGEFYQRMRAGTVSIATGEGQWAFGLTLLKAGLTL